MAKDETSQLSAQPGSSDPVTARFYKQYDQITETCSDTSLSPKLTHLVTLACHLASCRCDAATQSLQLARSVGASQEEINLVACLCACTAGPMAQDNYKTMLRSVRSQQGIQASGREQLPSVGSLREIGVSQQVQETYSLDENIFENLCSDTSLDKKSYHLVSLAACLASSCSCAAGHIVEARNAGATLEELARCACIAACASGLQKKYAFLEALRSVQNCSACDCAA
jgi:alkylhydroperoxidase/carboxymuconolactone decarboxylase family protein YurZ